MNHRDAPAAALKRLIGFVQDRVGEHAPIVGPMVPLHSQ
jgi:hypothetical protein